MSEVRLDFQRAPIKFERTPQGGLLLDSRPTRCGVFTYHLPNGEVRRELRHPDEVFKADSLATLAGAPITIDHPYAENGLVTPDNFTTLAKGTVADDVRADGEFVSAKVRVQDKKTMAKVENRVLVEMSCGYQVDLDWTPGEYKGERYDCIHRNIRYNHVALLEKNRGRAGNDVGLKLDSAYSDCMSEAAVEATVTFDAKDFVPRAEHDLVLGQLESAKQELAAAKVKLDSALADVAPAKVDALVTARLALAEEARTVAKDLKTDGKTPHEIRVEAVKAAYPNLNLDGKSEANIEGLFIGAVERAKGEATAHKTAQETNVNKDSKDTGLSVDKAAEAFERMQKRNAEAYKSANGKVN